METTEFLFLPDDGRHLSQNAPVGSESGRRDPGRFPLLQKHFYHLSERRTPRLSGGKIPGNSIGDGSQRRGSPLRPILMQGPKDAFPRTGHHLGIHFTTQFPYIPFRQPRQRYQLR